MFGFKRKKKKEALEQELLERELLQEASCEEEEDFNLDEIVAEFSEEAGPVATPEEEEPVEEETFTEEELIAEFSDKPVVEVVEEVAEAVEAPADEAAEEIVEEVAEEVVEEVAEEVVEETIEETIEEVNNETAEEAVSTDTVRLDIPAELHAENPVAIEDTIRIELPEKDEVTADTIQVDLSELDADTIRIDLPEDVSGDTIKITDITDSLGDTTPFTPVTEAKEETEPFSENWEPEYDQPMGEYIPPQPIQFQPKSRLRELKKKLVAGPERRFYEVSELGFGSLQVAILISLLMAVLSATTTVLYATGVLVERVKLVVFLQLFCMLMAALMGNRQLIDGMMEMFTKRFSLNSLLVLSFAACVADGIFCLRQQRIPCCAAFTIQMTMSLWSTYQKRSTEYGQMDTLRKATRLDSIVEQPDYYEGCVGFLRGEGQVEDFMEHYQERSAMDKITSVYAMVASGLSIVLGVVAGMIRSDISFGLQVLAAALLVSVPGTFFISTSRPMAILEKRLHKLGTVLCGWPKIVRLTKKAVFPLRHADLFPVGSCKLNGVKYYGDREPEQVVAYAAAVVAADGGGLTPVFEQLRQSRNGKQYGVQNLRLYGNGGIGGEVCGEPVLLGVHDFLVDMGVEIPEGTMVENAVYMAIDGELVAVFAVSCAKKKVAASGLATLCGYRGLRPLLVTRDFMLTEEFVRGKFGVNTRRMVFPEAPVRRELSKVAPEQGAPALAMTTRDGLASFAFAVSGARSVRMASILGLAIHLVGGILGLGAIAVLTVLAASGLITPVNMLLYQLVWMIPGLLVTEWTRSV